MAVTSGGPGGASAKRRGKGARSRSGPDEAPGVAARRTAVEALIRIDEGGAYANLVLGGLLDRSGLADKDRRFVTELVYGATRMRRACDWLVDRFLLGPTDVSTRAALRCGAYQLVFLATPPHAAVSTTVEAVRGPARKLVNAVLRRVATAGVPEAWPDEATRLSYPDWIVDRLIRDLGESAAMGALSVMNEAAVATERADGYVQDLGSQFVTDLVQAEPGHRVADLCAAPGGKATALAATGAHVVGIDNRAQRIALMAANRDRLGSATLALVAADAAQPPLRVASFDRVLLDAPCSGLGTLRRRPDARWRVDPDAPARLAVLQRNLLHAAASLVRPGGLLIYSVCTLTEQETTSVVQSVDLRGFEVLDAPGEPWQAQGCGAQLLPQSLGTDGMFVMRARRAAGSSGAT